MSADYARVKAVYLAAADLPEAERRGFLDRECGEDGELLARVQHLLGYAGDPRSLDIICPSPAEEDALPREIGGYRVVRRIGQGGMGVVYEAEQDEPRRRVAIKVLKVGFGGEKARRRFRQEAELLGTLNHPGITRIHEARSGEPGVPAFMVMELVRGLPITAHADRLDLALEGRLELAARTADAIQHAHDRGLVHRDIKPDNVLVDESGQPKVLDFGVARILDEEARTDSLRTHSGDVVGTVSYMSPEQASGNPSAVDARSDVYSLGVLCYELVTGYLPHDLRGKWLHEAVMTIRNEPPVRPRSRRADLPRDVETILLKALERDRHRRYPSADAFAEDLRCYLSGEPISAHPPSAAYQLRLFARRHRYLVSSTLLLILALSIGLWGTVRYAIRADEATDRVVAQRERAERTGRAIRLRAVGAAILAGRALEAERLLDGIPVMHRGWEWSHFRSRLDDYELAMGRDALLVSSVAFRPEDGALATLTRDGLLEFRSCRGFDVVDRLDLGKEAVAFTLAEGRIFIARADGGLEAWESERIARVDTGLDLSGVTLDASTDGSRCALRAANRSWLWVVSEGRILECSDNTKYAAISPDGKSVASAKLQLFDGTTGQSYGRFDDDVDRVLSASFSRSGASVAFGTERAQICIYDVASRKRQRILPGRLGQVRALEWTPDGRSLVAGDTQGAVDVWTVEGGDVTQSLMGNSEAVKQIAVSPDGGVAAVLTEVDEVLVWRMGHRNGVVVEDAHGAEVWSASYSPDGSMLATAEASGTVRLWNGWTNAPITSYEHAVAEPMGIAWGPEGRSIFISSRSATRELDLATGVVGGEVPEDVAARRTVWPGRLTHSRTSSGSGALFLRGEPGQKELVVTRAQDSSELHRIQMPHRMTGAAFSRDSRWLAVPLMSGEVVVFDGRTFEKLEVLSGHAGPVHCATFSPDGSRMATAGADRTVRLWDTDRFEETCVLEGHTGAILDVGFSPDGSRLVSASRDGSFRIWTTRSRHELVHEGLERRRVALERAGALTDAELEAAATQDALSFSIVLERELGRVRPETTRHQGESGSGLARSVALLQVADGARFVVGAPLANEGRGLLRILDRGLTTRGEIPGTQRGGRLGESVLSLPDLDGDGWPEIASGAPGLDGAAGTGCGSLLLFSGATREEMWRCEGRSVGEGFGGILLDAGDHDGDGVNEVFVGSKDSPGLVRLVSPGKRRVLREWSVRAPGMPSVQRAPDFDGDGEDDVVVVDGDRVEFRSGASDEVLHTEMVPAESERVTCVAVLEDCDGDGLPEMVTSYQGNSAPARVTMRPSSNPDAGWTVPCGPTAPSVIAERLRSVGDLDGDGVSEVAVWSAWRRPRQPQSAPAVTLISGATGRVVAEIPTPTDSKIAYGSAFLLADLDGDGGLYGVIGSPDTDPPRLEVIPLGIADPDRGR